MKGKRKEIKEQAQMQADEILYVSSRGKSKSNEGEGGGCDKREEKGNEGGEFRNCLIGFEKESEGEEEGEGPGAVFSVLSHLEEPPESRGSAEMHHDFSSDFML